MAKKANKELFSIFYWYVELLVYTMHTITVIRSVFDIAYISLYTERFFCFAG